MVVIGSGAASLTAALHLGEHSLLIERRSRADSLFTRGQGQGGSEDCSNTLPLGVARARVAGVENGGAKGQRQDVSAWERQAIAHLRPAGTPRQDEERCKNGEPVTLARWIPPDLQEAGAGNGEAEIFGDESLDGLAALVRGELRFDTRVCKIVPTTHVVELEDGVSIVYDKLISGVNAIELIALLGAELPNRIRSHSAMVHWLSARDIELVDDSTQFLCGDTSSAGAGRRVAEMVKRALAQKFRPATAAVTPGHRLFTPRLVGGLLPGAPAR